MNTDTCVCTYTQTYLCVCAHVCVHLVKHGRRGRSHVNNTLYSKQVFVFTMTFMSLSHLYRLYVVRGRNTGMHARTHARLTQSPPPPQKALSLPTSISSAVVVFS